MRDKKEKMQVAENTEKKIVDMKLYRVQQCTAMAKKSIPANVGLRPNQNDYAILSKLREKLGVDNSQIIRIALRKLAEIEGLKAS